MHATRPCPALSADLRVMTALRRGIPITLLCDLADPAGPASRHIYGAESPAAGTRPRSAVADAAAPTP